MYFDNTLIIGHSSPQSYLVNEWTLEFQKWLGNWSIQHSRTIPKNIFDISMPRALGNCDCFFWGPPFHKIRHGIAHIEVQVHFSNYSTKNNYEKPFKCWLKNKDNMVLVYNFLSVYYFPQRTSLSVTSGQYDFLVKKLWLLGTITTRYESETHLYF